MYRLLIMDDEPIIVEGLAEVLHPCDLPLKEIRIAYSAPEALRLFQDSAFDIVLADIRMPEMDGLAFFERIKKMHANCKVVYLTGYSDFEYAQRAMKLGASDYLLKPADDDELVASLRTVIGQLDLELKERMTLEHSANKLRSYLPVLQTDWLRGLLDERKALSPDKLANQFKSLSLPFQVNHDIYMLLIRIDEWNEKFEQRDDRLIDFAVRNMVNEMLQISCSLFSFPVEVGVMAITLQIEADAEAQQAIEALKTRIVEVQDTIYRVLGVIISLALLTHATSWPRWSIDMHLLITRMKLTLSKGALLMNETDKERMKPPENIGLQDLIQDLNRGVQSRDMSLFAHCLDRYIPESFRDKNSQSPMLAIVYISISNWMVNTIFQYNLNYLLDTGFIEKLANFYKHRSVDEIRSFLLSTFGMMLEKIAIYEQNPSGVLIDHLKTYIAEHLGEDLSLNRLAQHVHMNPSYLSRVFSQHTNEQLIPFITKLKMEQAQSMLLGGQMKIGEIAKRLGYDNPNYFAKLFRKSTGKSPQDYRKNL